MIGNLGVVMKFTEIAQQIIDYNDEVYDLGLWTDEGVINTDSLKDYVNAVKCFQQYDEINEFTVDQILNKFIGKWDNRNAHVEEALLNSGVESRLQDIQLPCPNGSVPMFIECLDYDKIWETMSQMEGALKGYKWNDPDDEEADHQFYVYDMTR